MEEVQQALHSTMDPAIEDTKPAGDCAGGQLETGLPISTVTATKIQYAHELRRGGIADSDLNQINSSVNDGSTTKAIQNVNSKASLAKAPLKVTFSQPKASPGTKDRWIPFLPATVLLTPLLC
jgi:hypothetical protein